MNEVSATVAGENQNRETELYCRYVFSGRAQSGNAVEGIVTTVADTASNVVGWVGGLFGRDWNFYQKNQLEHGVLAYTIVDVVMGPGNTIEIKASASSRLFAQFDSNLDVGSFYRGDQFVCPSKIYANHDGQSNNGFTRLTLFTNNSSAWYNLINWGTTYHFDLHRNRGPLERPIDRELVNMSDLSCEGILGPFKRDLEGILRIMRIAAPILVVFLGTYDYIHATLSKDAEQLKKSNGKLTKRLFLIALLFFLPTLISLVLGIIDSSYASCGFH
jgi:hypothetical protein